MLWLRQLVYSMTQVKRGGGRPAFTRKMQRYSLMKAIGALVLCLMFAAVLLRNDPFPGVRKAAMRHRRQAAEETPNGERDFRDPNAEESTGGAIDGQGEDGNNDNQEEAEGREFTFELAGLKDGKTGKVVIRTKPSWAPIGAAHFHELVDGNFYDLAKFFRVVDNFVVQFGIAADPKNKRPEPLVDDPVLETNAYGTLTYATSGPNTRSTQLFINTRKEGNKFLDKQGFSPFAQVTRYVVCRVASTDIVQFFYNSFTHNLPCVLAIIFRRIVGWNSWKKSTVHTGKNQTRGKFKDKGMSTLTKRFRYFPMSRMRTVGLH
jgi:cyclophilin family peptidyl-prolyl cis-trans isomerase